MRNTPKPPAASRLNLPLLKSESPEEYFNTLAGLTTDIKPNGMVEQLYIEDMAVLVIEIRRLQRCKTYLITSAYYQALRNILKAVVFDRQNTNNPFKVEELSRNWFTAKHGKAEVLRILRPFDMDESAIEAEAIRLKSPELEIVGRMLTLAWLRFDKSLRSVSDYKESLARRLRQSAEQMLQSEQTLHSEEMPALEYTADQPSIS